MHSRSESICNSIPLQSYMLPAFALLSYAAPLIALRSYVRRWSYRRTQDDRHDKLAALMVKSVIPVGPIAFDRRYMEVARAHASVTVSSTRDFALVEPSGQVLQAKARRSCRALRGTLTAGCSCRAVSIETYTYMEWSIEVWYVCMGQELRLNV
ncbi:hypothetical protein PENSPDRAFT_221504 [Peniophora sp. CONT]|nr:hypothetical protein PENSPDRAFT_221504 [Peniophora sp. CONT]